jgi:hypothetical protein
MPARAVAAQFIAQCCVGARKSKQRDESRRYGMCGRGIRYLSELLYAINNHLYKFASRMIAVIFSFAYHVRGKTHTRMRITKRDAEYCQDALVLISD